jgi:hypothetical protein
VACFMTPSRKLAWMAEKLQDLQDSWFLLGILTIFSVWVASFAAMPTCSLGFLGLRLSVSFARKDAMSEIRTISCN